MFNFTDQNPCGTVRNLSGIAPSPSCHLRKGTQRPTKMFRATEEFQFCAIRSKKLLGAPRIATRNKKLLGVPGRTTRSNKLLGPLGIATRNKKLLGAPGRTIY